MIAAAWSSFPVCECSLLLQEYVIFLEYTRNICMSIFQKIFSQFLRHYCTLTHSEFTSCAQSPRRRMRPQRIPRQRKRRRRGIKCWRTSSKTSRIVSAKAPSSDWVYLSSYSSRYTRCGSDYFFLSVVLSWTTTCSLSLSLSLSRAAVDSHSSAQARWTRSRRQRWCRRVRSRLTWRPASVDYRAGGSQRSSGPSPPGRLPSPCTSSHRRRSSVHFRNILMEQKKKKKKKSRRREKNRIRYHVYYEY